MPCAWVAETARNGPIAHTAGFAARTPDFLCRGSQAEPTRSPKRTLLRNGDEARIDEARSLSHPRCRRAALRDRRCGGFACDAEAEWPKRWTRAQFVGLRKQGTEWAFSSPLDHEKRSGLYSCAGCDLPLFSSKTKFDSGTGWPSFWAPLPNAVATTTDNSLFEVRTEVHCRRCLGHLGHVFDDGPKPTGLRYCMNGVALTFRPNRG